jgi:hypothetical protein
MQIDITLTGLKPMLQHNIRLANPLDPYTQKLKEFTGKRKKTDEDLAEIMWWEARGSAYETTEGFLGMPCDNVWRSLYDAATAFKQGANLKRALIPDTDIEPLLVAGEKVYVDEFLKAGNIDTRAVQVSRARTMRSRPMVDTPWSVTHRFELLSDIIDVRELDPITERAGRVVGIGDYRPRFGTFTATVTEV